MTIEFAILGLLSLRALTGYDINKVFAGTAALYLSDNNNQIYRMLLKLHREQLVEQEIQVQENYPARKIYRITEKGLEELRKWAGSPAELPLLKQTILIQLAWADLLDEGELDRLLGTYEEEVQMQLWMCQSEQEAEPNSPGGSEKRNLYPEIQVENGARSLSVGDDPGELGRTLPSTSWPGCINYVRALRNPVKSKRMTVYAGYIKGKQGGDDRQQPI